MLASKSLSCAESVQANRTVTVCIRARRLPCQRYYAEKHHRLKDLCKQCLKPLSKHFQYPFYLRATGVPKKKPCSC